MRRRDGGVADGQQRLHRLCRPPVSLQTTLYMFPRSWPFSSPARCAQKGHDAPPSPCQLFQTSPGPRLFFLERQSHRQIRPTLRPRGVPRFSASVCHSVRPRQCVPVLGGLLICLPSSVPSTSTAVAALWELLLRPHDVRPRGLRHKDLSVTPSQVHPRPPVFHTANTLTPYRPSPYAPLLLCWLPLHHRSTTFSHLLYHPPMGIHPSCLSGSSCGPGRWIFPCTCPCGAKSAGRTKEAVRQCHPYATAIIGECSVIPCRVASDVLANSAAPSSTSAGYKYTVIFSCML